jgi:hypothetical protein
MEVSRDTVAALRREGLIAAGPRSTQPGAPYACVPTPAFLTHFGFKSLRDLPDMEKLEDAGLLGRASADAPSGPGARMGNSGLLADLPGALAWSPAKTVWRKTRRGANHGRETNRSQQSGGCHLARYRLFYAK